MMRRVFTSCKRALAGVALTWLACTAWPAGAKEKDVVVVGGALTEIVYALGAEKRIAATDTTSMYPPQALATPKVGYLRSLNAEGLIAMKPGLVLAAGEAGPPAAIAQTRAAGIRFEQLPVEYSMTSVLDRVARVAALLDLPSEGGALAKRLRTQWDATRDKVSGYAPPRPKVLFLLAHTSAVQVAGRDTAAHAVIELAGGDNAFAAVSGYKPLTAEAAVSAAPDILLVTTQGLDGQGGIDGLLKRPGLALTPAGRNRRVIHVDALELLGFGPRVPRTVAALAEQFYNTR
jgi:iron complex transport system substrate-binding protein